jgi:ferric hydroxamate transport system substrate-binding protein
LTPTSRRRTRLPATALVLATLLAAVACGGSDDEASGAGSGSGTGRDGEWPVTVETPNGPVTIEEPPERIVALEWVYVEDLLALGVTPVGVADVEGYRDWVDVDAALPDDVTDVGTRQEPSIERIAMLEPDLIVTDTHRAAASYDELSERAPTIAFEPAFTSREEGGQWEVMERTLRDLGRATGRAGEAETVLDELGTTVDDAAAQVAEAQLDTNRFVLGLAGDQNGQPGFRMSTDNALMVDALTRIGLENAWDAPPAEWGFTEATVEAVSEVDGDLHFLYVAQAEDDVVDDLAGNDLWEGLEFVQAGHVYDMGPDLWLYGGPLSVESLLERVVEALRP